MTLTRPDVPIGPPGPTSHDPGVFWRHSTGARRAPVPAALRRPVAVGPEQRRNRDTPTQRKAAAMLTLRLILLLLALGCFACATFGVTSRVNLIGAGLALWILTLLLIA
jgi:hypothetical protein